MSDSGNEIEGLHNAEVLGEDDLDTVLNSVPPKYKKVVERILISSTFQMRSISSPETEVMKKITSEHISQYLRGSEEDMKNTYKEKFHNKLFAFLLTLLFMVFIITMILLLKDNPGVMEKVIYTAGGLTAGAFGGYGFGKKHTGE